jgi:hypothetical protein
MTGCIAAQHIMRLDYLDLHLSRHYRAGLRGAHLAYKSSRAAGRVAATPASQALPAFNRQPSGGGMKRGRNATAGRIDAMQPPPMRMVTSLPEEDEDELFGYGPPLPTPAAGGRASLGRTRSSAIGRPEMGAPVQPVPVVQILQVVQVVQPVAAAEPCCGSNQTEAAWARGDSIAEEEEAAAGFPPVDPAAVDAVGAVSTGSPESSGLRRSARIEGMLKSVVRVSWGARLAHRMHKEANMMFSLDRQFSDLISQQPPALPQPDAAAPPGQPESNALLRGGGSAHQSLRNLPPRLSEDLSYWGF